MYTVLFSAVLYVIPFWYPAFWPLIFLFPALLIRIQQTTLLAASIWGITISIGHLFPVAQALYGMCQGPIIFKLVPGAILIGYVALCATLWLAIASRLKNNMVWLIALWLFLLFLDRAVILPLSGQLEGSVFMNPLVILPPWLLILLPYLGTSALLALFCITSYTIGLWFCHKVGSLLLFLSFIPWIISIFIIESHETKFPYKNIGYLPIMIPKNSNASLVLLSKIRFIQASHPHITTIIAPESSCHTLPMINAPLNLIIGSFENYNTIRSNIACWIHGTHKHIFRKTHTMVFGEKLPYWFDNNFFQDLIFSTALPILKADNERPQWQLDNNVTLVPYLCSELFLSDSPRDNFNNPILAMCNDWWFPPHFKNLMARAARLRAIQWGRPILYVSYSQGQFFDQFGTAYPIERL